MIDTRPFDYEGVVYFIDPITGEKFRGAIMARLGLEYPALVVTDPSTDVDPGCRSVPLTPEGCNMLTDLLDAMRAADPETR